MSATQTPLQCKDQNDSSWMFNDQRQSPCQVLSSSIQKYDSGFNLTWLDLSFQCPHPSNRTSIANGTITDLCCSSITFSLYSACWACQFDQPVQGVVQTNWGQFSSNCSLHSVGNGQQTRGLNGALPLTIQSTLSAANIHIPSWAFLTASDNSTWDESAAKLNATSTISTSSAPAKLSKGCIAGIVLGSFALLCATIFVVTVICMRKRERSRIESYAQRLPTFRPKKRVVNIGEKGVETRSRTPGTGMNRLLDTSGRVDLALDDELASPESAKGYKAPRRVNSDMDTEMTHEAMLPTLTAAHGELDRPSSTGVAARLASNVRRSLGRVGSSPKLPRLGRHSGPGRPEAVVPFTMAAYNGATNRYTHPMTQSSNMQPFAVPLSPQQMGDAISQSRPPLQTINTAPPTAWHGFNSGINTIPMHRAHNSAPILINPEPTPLTEEALAVARVAQDGTLFVPDSIAQWRKTATGIPPAKPDPPRDENEDLVRTISIERMRLSRNADAPVRSDSLSRRPLVLHEAPTEGATKKKTTVRQRGRDVLGGEESSRAAGSGVAAAYAGVASRDVVRPSAPLDSPLETQQPGSSSSRPFPSSTRDPRNLPAPVARKPVPKSDIATAGSGKDEDDVSLATAEIQNITSSSPRSGGRSGNGNGKGRGRHPKDEDAIRQSLAAHTSFSGGNIKSDGSRTPSPKVAPSAEWFDLFRRGTVPPSFTPGGSAGNGNDGGSRAGAGDSNTDLTRNKTAPAPGPSKRRENQPSTSNIAPTSQRFQPITTAISSYDPNPNLPSGAAFYKTPIAATYATSSTPYLPSSQSSAQPSSAAPPAVHQPHVRTMPDAKPVSLGQPVTLNRSVPAPVGARPVRMLPKIPPGAPPPPEE